MCNNMKTKMPFFGGFFQGPVSELWPSNSQKYESSIYGMKGR